MRISPLTTDHTVAMRVADDAVRISDRLADEAIKRAGLEVHTARDWKAIGGRYWTFHPEENSRPWHPGGYRELMRSPHGEHQKDGPPEPVFLAGLTLPEEAAERLAMADLAEWRLAIETDPRHFFISRKRLTRVFSAMPLAALATASASFDGQVNHLAEWLGGAIRGIEALDPGIDWEASPPNRPESHGPSGSNSS